MKIRKMNHLHQIKPFSMIALLLFAITAPIMAQNKNGYLIKGGITGLKDGTSLYLVRKISTKETDTIATATSQKEKFSFTGKVPLEAEFYFLRIDSFISNKAKAILLLNDTIDIEGDIATWPESLIVKGSLPHNQYHRFLKTIVEPTNKLDVVLKLRGALRRQLRETRKGTGIGDSTLIKRKLEEVENRYEVASEEYTKTYTDYIDSLPNSLYTPHLILKTENILGINGMKKKYAKLSPTAQESYYGLELQRRIETLERTTRIQIGEISPDFTLTTPQGEHITLKEVASKNELTLIDFWASWCVPCRAQIPRLKKIYEAFHKRGFGILGVSSDDNEYSWKKALEQDNTPWLHGIQNPEKNASEIFDIGAIPAYVLIDREGKIVAIDIANSSVKSAWGSLRGDDLYKKVEEILGKHSQDR